MYFKYGNKINYEFDNTIHQIPVTTETTTREPHILTLLPTFNRYISNINLCKDLTLENFNAREAVAGQKYKYDPRIQVFQSARPYYSTTS